MIIKDEIIQDFAYKNNPYVDYVVLEESVLKVGEKAFANAPNLISVRIVDGDNPIKICLDAFQGCKHLVEVSSKRETIFYKKIKYKRSKDL